MRESIASALYSNLHDGLGDCPVTRLHAFSKSPRLSTLLWRLKYGNDVSCFHDAQRLVANHLNARKARSGQRMRASGEALNEWVSDQCKVCLGAGVMMIEDLKIVCSGCEGLGKRRYSDAERGRNTRLVAEALAVIVKFDSIPAYVIRRELER